MAFVLVHTFTNGGYDWNIYADFDTLAIQVINDPPPPVTGGTVDESILGFPEGGIMREVCSTVEQYTLNTLKAQFEPPYAYFEQTINSTACGYVAPSCVIDYTTTITNAINSGNNGRLEVAITDAGAIFFNYRFSLDNGATWQSSPVFTGLFPGTYTLTIQKSRKSPGGTFLFPCNQVTSIVIGNDVIPVTQMIPIPYQDSINLCFFFRLIIGGVTTDIREPVGWDALDITGERDMQLHGWQWGYSDGEFPLKFPCTSGGNLIMDEYEENGNDGDVQFKYGFTYQETEYELFSGRVMLNSLKKYPDRVEAVIETDQFDAKLISRVETEVSMKETQGYDGATIVPPDSLPLNFHAKKILSQLVVDNPGKTYSDLTRIEQESFWVLFDLSNPTRNDIRESNTFTLLGTSGNPIPDQYVTRFEFDGVTDISFAATIGVDMELRNPNIIGSVTGTARVEYVRRLKQADGSFLETAPQIISNEVSISVPALSTVGRTANLVASLTVNDYSFKSGESIFIYVSVAFAENIQLKWTNIVQSTCTLNIQHEELTADSVGNVWFLDDALRHIISVITNNQYIFRSSFFERANFQNIADGQASKRVLTNGFQIRRFNVDERPLKTNLKRIVDSLNAQNCIGSEYAKDINGISRVRIERRDFFYQDNQILAIEGSIEEYYEEVAKELIYNEGEFGYEKYLETGFNSLDEFNTKNNVLTPIKKNPNKLGQVAKVITSGYSIEDTRRQQFEETPSDSYDNDEETFMVVVRKDSNNDWVTEKDEPFSTVTDVISPETSYNLRLSPKRSIYNWFIWLKGIFAYKSDTELIRNTKFIQNGDLTTQFDSGEVDVIGDLDKSLIQEKENIELTSLASTPDIYRPEWVYVTCRASPDKVQLINEAMNGLSDITKNYGYIMVKKPDGVWQAGWIFSLKYNYATEKLTLKLLKKFTSPAEPVEDCCPWLVANGCYILANGERIIA